VQVRTCSNSKAVAAGISTSVRGANASHWVVGFGGFTKIPFAAILMIACTLSLRAVHFANTTPGRGYSAELIHWDE
jgi:hypothetical protein